MRALPIVGQLDHGLRLSPQGLRGDKALQIKRLVPREHVIPGARELLRQHGERFGFAVFVCHFRKVRFARLIVTQEQGGGFRKRPAQMDGADLLARGAQPFVVRLFGAFD